MIRNPFAGPEEKKPKFKSAYEDGVDTEHVPPPPPEIILDGGRFCIHLKQATSAKEAGERLLTFFHALETKDSKRSAAYGVQCVSEDYEAAEGEVLLRYGTQAISIYTGEDLSPEAAYRRIGYVLRALQLSTLQKKLGITVVERM